MRKENNNIDNGFIFEEEISSRFKHSNYSGFLVFKKKGVDHDQPTHRAFEKYPLGKLKALEEYLTDTLYTLENTETFVTNSDDSEVLDWYKDNLKKVNRILNLSEDYFFLSPTHMFVHMMYKQSKEDAFVGRLYGKKPYSMQYLPREIRGFLFESNEYFDFDMVNSHPTLLLEYRKEFMPTINTSLLERYVTDRDSLCSEKALLDGVKKDDTKEMFLITLNTKESHVKTLGSFCLDLYHEVKEIRNHMYTNLYKEGSELFLYFENNSDFEQKDIESKKISVQSLYLQTRETDYVYSLMEYLFQETEEYIKNIEDSRNTFRLGLLKTNKTDIICDMDYFLSCVPFFDGLYVTSECPFFKQRLVKLVELFNEKLKKEGRMIQFKEKKIASEYKKIDKDKLYAYYNVRYYLNDLTLATFYELLNLLDIKKLIFEEKDLEGMISEARIFRRQVYQSILEEDIPLNAEFLTRLRQKYLYKTSTDKEGSGNDIPFHESIDLKTPDT